MACPCRLSGKIPHLRRVQRDMRHIAAALFCVACSASPHYHDTCDPQPPSVPVCCPSCSESDLGLSRRVWGAYENCSDPDAIQIDAVEVPCNNVEWLGCARVGGTVVQYRHDGPHIPITLAHEIGHCMGLEHTTMACELMNGDGSLGGACGTVSIDGCEFAVGPWSPD